MASDVHSAGEMSANPAWEAARAALKNLGGKAAANDNRDNIPSSVTKPDSSEAPVMNNSPAPVIPPPPRPVYYNYNHNSSYHNGYSYNNSGYYNNYSHAYYPQG